jgi:hypothetical protein
MFVYKKYNLLSKLVKYIDIQINTIINNSMFIYDYIVNCYKNDVVLDNGDEDSDNDIIDYYLGYVEPLPEHADIHSPTFIGFRDSYDDKSNLIINKGDKHV